MKVLFTSTLMSTLLVVASSISSAYPNNCSEVQAQFEETHKKVQAAFAQARVADKIPGLTYSVATDSCVLMSGQDGVANLKTEAKLDVSKSLFRMASVSKIFTAISVSQLIEKGILRPETKLMDLNKVSFVRYLKKYEKPERLAQWSRIEIGQLMSHQSGISKDVPGALVFFNTESLAQNSYPTMHEFYRGLTSVEFLFEAGHVTTGFKYSNLGMNILARVVEAYNPMSLSFPEYVEHSILEPLRMNSTYYDVPRSKRNDMVTGYGSVQADGQRIEVPKAYYVGSYDGSIGVATTASDLNKLGVELLRIANGKSRLLKSTRVINNLLQMKSPVNSLQGWASGPMWMSLPGELNADPVWLGHTGTGASERTIVVASPEKNLSIAIAFNNMEANREKYVKIISDLIPSQIVQVSPVAKAHAEAARAFLKATPPPQNITPNTPNTPDKLEKYVGGYRADIPGVQQITMSDDGFLVFYGQKLAVEDLTLGKFRFPPIPGPGGTLFNSEPVVFSFDSDGKPVSIRVANVKIFRRVN